MPKSVHNGKTLEQVLDGSFDGNGNSTFKSVHRIPNANDRAKLIAFLQSIDETTPIFP